MPFAPAFDRRDSIYYECHGSGPHKIFFLMGILTPGEAAGLDPASLAGP